MAKLSGKNAQFYFKPSYASSTIAFNDNGGSPDTIVDSTGSFLKKGFYVGQSLTVLNSSGNTNDGTYTITVITASIISVATGSLSATQGEGTAVILDVAIPSVALVGGFLAGEAGSDGSLHAISPQVEDVAQFAVLDTGS